MLSLRPSRIRHWTCPILHCGSHPIPHAAGSSDETKYIRTHLVKRHDATALASIPGSFFAQYKLHPCRQCHEPLKIYLHAGDLHNHERSHIPAPRLSDAINSTLISDTFQSIPFLDNRWSAALPWLHHLPLTPPPFRESHFNRLSPNVRDAVIASYGDIVQLVIDSTPSLSPTFLSNHPLLPEYECSSVPFWNLLFLFEAII